LRGFRGLLLVALLAAFAPGLSSAQTPSPLQEWQYSGGIALEKLFESEVPDWRVVLGAGAELKPLYDGATDYRVQGGPVINIRYQDWAFASIGEGLGVNIWNSDHYRAGIALTYDLGRKVSDDLTHLRGLGDIPREPAFKIFGSWVLSKDFPLVVRADMEQIVKGADGVVGDFGAFMPLPGSSKRFIMFAGPSVSFASHSYEQHVFGVSDEQSLNSGYPQYHAHAGVSAAGFGFSATGFLTDHWLVNLDTAVNHLYGSALDSPITQRTVQHVLALSSEYMW